MQRCLDVAVCMPPLFSGNFVDVGPGAVEDLWRLFPGQGSGETGMIRKRSAQVSARPLCHEIARLCADKSVQMPGLLRLRAVLDALGLPSPCPSSVQYWCCERRQIRRKLDDKNWRKGSRAPLWYIEAFQKSSSFPKCYI